MKKRFLTVVFVFAALLSLWGQPSQQQQMTAEDVQQALSLVEKAQAAPDKVKPGLDAITAEGTMAMLTFVASDLTEGRDTASQGYDIAAEYAASLFKMWGVKPAGDMPSFRGRFRMGGAQGGAQASPPQRTYFQEFAMKQTGNTQSSITIEVNDSGAIKARTFHGGVDFQGGGSAAGKLTAPVVFIGYGINEPSISWNELKGLDLKGKVVLMLTEAPGKDDPKSPFQTNKELKDKYFPAAPQANMMMMRRGGGGGRFNKITEIAKLGPAAIVQVQNTGTDAEIFKSLSTESTPNDEQPIINRSRARLSIAGDTRPGRGAGSPTTVTITREMANALLEATGQTIDDLKAKIETTMKPASMSLTGARMTIETTVETSLVRCKNVIGMIEGSDPELKDEYFVIGAHYDHLGKWEDYIYNGADDNGSGSVGVLNIAKAIAASPVKPKRSVVFALWTGEEKGLLGSQYYVQNPIYPIEKTVGYLNYDMISRPYDDETIARRLQSYSVSGTEELVKKIRAPWFVTVNLTEETLFPELTREMNQYIGLDLAMRRNALGVGSGGSDHASFASVNVPYIYYMAAMTSDYHRTSDSVDKVSGELIAKISQHGFLVVYAFADK